MRFLIGLEVTVDTSTAEEAEKLMRQLKVITDPSGDVAYQAYGVSVLANKPTMFKRIE